MKTPNLCSYPNPMILPRRSSSSTSHNTVYAVPPSPSLLTQQHSLRFAVLGAGFAGLSVVWHLFKQSPKELNIKIDIYDQVGIGGGASGISGGLLHPYSPKVKPLWEAAQCWKESIKLLNIAEEASLSKNCTIENMKPFVVNKRGILRPAMDMKNMTKLNDNAKTSLSCCRVDTLNNEEAQGLLPGLVLPFNTAFFMPEALNINPQHYLEALFQACENLVKESSSQDSGEKQLSLHKRSVHGLSEFEDKMNPAMERVARQAMRRKGKEGTSPTEQGVVGATGSGKSSSGPVAGASSPQPVSCMLKRVRIEIDLTREKEKGQFVLPPCWLERKFFEASRAVLPHAEKIKLDALDRPSKRAALAEDAGALMRVLEVAVAYSEQNQTPDAELLQLKVRLAEIEKKAEDDRKKWSEERGTMIDRYEAAVNAAQKDAREAKEELEQLRKEVAPDENEPAEFSEVRTRAEFISRIHQAYDDAMVASSASFENAVLQVRVLNLEVESKTDGMGVNYFVEGGAIRRPDFLLDDIVIGETPPQPIVETSGQPAEEV